MRVSRSWCAAAAAAAWSRQQQQQQSQRCAWCRSSHVVVAVAATVASQQVTTVAAVAVVVCVPMVAGIHTNSRAVISRARGPRKSPNTHAAHAAHAPHAAHAAPGGRGAGPNTHIGFTSLKLFIWSTLPSVIQLLLLLPHLVGAARRRRAWRLDVGPPPLVGRVAVQVAKHLDLYVRYWC